MNEQIWNRWKRDWEWVLSSMKRKGAETEELGITPPVPSEHVEWLVRECSLVLPTEFVEVLTGYSSSITLDWSLPDSDIYPSVTQSKPFVVSGSGGDWSLLWDFSYLEMWN